MLPKWTQNTHPCNFWVNTKYLTFVCRSLILTDVWVHERDAIQNARAPSKYVWCSVSVCFTEFKCILMCFSVFQFKCIWVCEMQTYCWVVHLVGWRGTRVVELACWGAKSFSISINLFSFLPMVFIWNEHSRLFDFVKGPLISSLFASSWLFRKETAVKMWQDLQTHLKSCLPSSLTSISRPILSWMLMRVISSFTKMQNFDNVGYMILKACYSLPLMFCHWKNESSTISFDVISKAWLC